VTPIGVEQVEMRITRKIGLQGGGEAIEVIEYPASPRQGRRKKQATKGTR
jgi:hypothetical protein